MTTYTYTTLNDPLGTTGTVATGINASGEIVGYYVDSNGNGHGFLYSGGNYTNDLMNPVSSVFIPYGINTSGQIVGFYYENVYPYSPGIDGPYGWLDSGSTWTSLNTDFAPYGINASGQIVGRYDEYTGNGSVSHGFLYSGGTYATLDDPSASLANGGTIPQGINDLGQIVGIYIDTSGAQNGFLYSGGSYTLLNDPLATNGTFAYGINDAGQIVGHYQDATGDHGFLYSGGVYTTFNVPLARNTLPFGINNTGEIVGTYTDGTGDHGFLATPIVTTTPPAITESPANDTGSSSSDKITSNLTLTGSGDPNAVVHFTMDGNPIAGTATADAGSIWTFMPTGLSDGSHTVVASETDAAGNTGTASLTFTLDTTAPTTPAAPADSAVLNGYVNAAHNTAAQTLTGNAEDGSTVTIYDNGTQVGTRSADAATGAWSLPIGQLADGSSHSYTVTATDAAGNVSQPSDPLAFTVDTTMPTVAVSIDKTIVNAVDPTAQVTFTFSKPPVDFSLNDVTSTDGTLSNLSGSGTTYTATFTAAPGIDDNAATVSVMNGSYHDAAGNAGTGASAMSPVQFSSAVATFYEIENNWAPSQMIDGIFTGPNGGINGWSVFNSATQTSAGADALLTLASPLPAGEHNLTFTIYQNYYGNPGHILGDFALDYTTAVSPTLSSTQTPVSIQNASSLNGTTFSLLSPGELLANTSQNSIGTDTYTISASIDSPTPITGIFLDAIKNPSLPGGGPGGKYGNGNFVVSEFTLDASNDGSTAPFTVDTVVPTVAVSIDNTDVDVAHGSGTVSFTFSEAPLAFALTDTSAVGGTLSNLQQTGATHYTATFTGAANADIRNASVSVSAGSWQEGNGNAGTGGSTASFTVDTVTPTVAVSIDNTDVNVAHGTGTVTFSFSEAPTDFTLANVTAAGGTLGPLTASADGKTYTAVFTAAAGKDIGNGSVSVDSTWHEANGNPGTGATTAAFVVDTVTPTASVAVNSSDVNLAHNTATVTFTFSEAPTDFTLANVTATGGTLGPLTASADGKTYTATFTANSGTDISNGSVSIDSKWHEANGNLGTGATSAAFVVDTVTPTASVAVNSSDVNLAHNTATVTFTFSEAPTDFSLPHTSAVGGTLGNLSGSGTTYTAVFTAAAGKDISNGSVSVDSTWHEANGNPGTGATTAAFVVDTVTPTASVAVNSSDVNLAHNTATVTFTFSEAPTDFTLANVTATGGTLGPLTASADGKTYTATFTANSGTDISNGSVSIDSKWHEANGNLGTGATSAAFVVDTVTPTASVAVNSSDVNLAHNTATVTFTFSEAPTDFSLPHTSAVGGTLGNLSGSGTTYTAVFTAAAGKDISNGSVSVDSTWHEANGNPGTGATTAAFVVDTVTPTVAVSINSATLNLAHNTATVTFTFSEEPVSFVLSDTSAVGGTLSNLQKINATQYTAIFTAATNTLIHNASVNVTAGSWQEGNSNAGAAGSTGNFIVDTMDHWTNVSGGKWTTASSWSNGVPSANVEAAVDTNGTYTVSITTADTAYALLLNDTGATVSDNTGGTLTLAGTGGASNPTGMLTVNAGTFALAGGALKAGTISIVSGGSLLVSASYTGLSNAIVDNGSITVSGKNSSFASNISGSGAINVQNGAAATFNGAITGSEAFTITNTSKAIVNTAITGTGSFALSGSGSLEFGAADSENVTFTSGASGTVKFDHSLTAPFTGYLSGLSTKNAVDLADLAWTQGKMKATFSGNTSGGTLTVTNGTSSVALKLLGNYTTASWTLSKDSTGGTRVVDPPVTGSLSADANGGAAAGIDLSGISFGANTTLAYSANSNNTGGTLTVSDGLHAQSVALLGQYMASSLVMTSDGHSGTLITDPPLNQQALLTHHG